jgi:hypothetical protein
MIQFLILFGNIVPVTFGQKSRWIAKNVEISIWIDYRNKKHDGKPK